MWRRRRRRRRRRRWPAARWGKVETCGGGAHEGDSLIISSSVGETTPSPRPRRAAAFVVRAILLLPSDHLDTAHGD
uniref:Uncharacterized protein n=1 Tax=Oryza meridionalis TaxID=40149 RepID=A0A0E0C5Y9_9ORYZ